MALSNADVLANLREQKTQLEQSLESNRTTLLKVLGAIDVLEQIEEQSDEETPAEEE
jgi:hypothetical protein